MVLVLLVGSYRARARVSELPSLLEASSHPFIDTECLPRKTGRERNPQAPEPPGRAGGEIRCLGCGGSDMEAIAGRVYLYRVRPLHRRVPGGDHGQTPFSEKDHCRYPEKAC